MSNLQWRDRAQDPVGAKPEWFSVYIPMCTEQCPNHDGKRCMVLGLRAPRHCEPVIEQMGMILTVDEVVK